MGFNSGFKGLTLTLWNKTQKKIRSRYALPQNVTTNMRDKCMFNVKFPFTLPQLVHQWFKETHMRKMHRTVLPHYNKTSDIIRIWHSGPQHDIQRPPMFTGRPEDEVHFTGHHDKALVLRLPVLGMMELHQKQQGKPRLSGELQGQRLYQPRRDMNICAFI